MPLMESSDLLSKTQAAFHEEDRLEAIQTQHTLTTMHAVKEVDNK
jgi:hypothetical protein